ncbi:hypothetical protein BKA67DRAFT_669048 [Truncatella angustata]|uniref:Uncharacterized protein n=1 Tax=Truncatella angustata TaxID=152316 RepID=A0A9P8RI37_9PEZI|nr:uncharacterized protein BKA67DRAFT_669048 [Truncatella angustata]KAH6646272.1 hypothetical protein BKA67DRAFT_669048 [Truncatella angustata]KAH8203921.1 hypothetical protein TruAng_001863 [Truncatella angustata]
MVSRPGRPAPPPPPDHTSQQAPRIEVTATNISVFGYPSSGEPVIALEDVSVADIDYLQLDRLKIPKYRLQDQGAEDNFCRRLLHLGGRRWPTLDRFRLLLDAIAGNDVVIEWILDGTEPCPSSAERRWISVARPSGGGVCVADVPRWIPEVVDGGEVSVEENAMLERRALLKLAVDMDEKARLLVDEFKGKHYEKANAYDGGTLTKDDLC